MREIIRPLGLAWTAGFAWALLASPAPADDARKVTIQGIGAELGETPVIIALTDDPPAPGPYVLLPATDSPTLTAGDPRADVFEDAGKTYLGLVLKGLKADEQVTYRLEPAPEAEAGVRLEATGDDVQVSIGGEPFTVYRTREGTKPYLYPVIGPTGKPMTRAFPMEEVEGEERDHPHQRSFWFTHGDVNGYDFWASDPLNRPSPRHGRIVETEKRTVSSGSAVGVLRTCNDWLTGEGEKLCEDERTIRFYDTEEGRIVDFDITIKATNGPVTFGDTKEGTFGIRIASSMDVKRKQGGRITNAEGITDGDAWGKASPWVDYTGPIDGQTVGVAILNHPESFRHPTTWHVRDYGLFAANPFGYKDFGQDERGDHELAEGESITFRYRVIFHKGDTEEASIPNAYKAYAEPPKVEIQSN
ncbi:hypothetical protein BH23PLA1_BH23PLA1_22980 [soil metagenome]